ncbi:CTP synthase [Candidatus Trichorickettsia mobilis]|uniref:CTP synthase n=1 Tax=Candidatus Trichorickettsia mobilis TaxID=1346319 RepID=UPI00292CD441|nr:CTP synthase [Candidatus Trichorickettsia mobilis]
MTTKFIFITGGVASSLGKGIASAALGALLQARGFSVTLRKLDPYLNVDPGTMSPHQHGEVFVTEDGMETDLDLGHYERFTGINATIADYVTTGQIYSNVIAQERKGVYLGATVQVIPHITDEIKRFILNKTANTDFILCEIGGTVGDIESLPYLEAIRQLRNELGSDRTLFIHLTLLPYIHTAEEIKTKPAQHSVKELLSVGIQADILICRSDRLIPIEARTKLAQFCNVQNADVLAALDAQTIYHVPLQYHQAGFDQRVCKYFGVNFDNHPINLDNWQNIIERIENPTYSLRIAIAGKYIKLKDAYKSLIEAITHAGITAQAKIELVWVDTEQLDDIHHHLNDIDGIIIPGGFGTRGIDGKIAAIKFARQNKIPTLGICLGMQLTIIEACRNVLGISNASSTEFGQTAEPVIALMTEWLDPLLLTQQRNNTDNKGGTMRLGSYPCQIKNNTNAYAAYEAPLIFERHRHRYEVNLKYRNQLEEIGLIFSGMSPDGQLTEIIEWRDHPWFVAAQFHPELKSLPFKPHPLFKNFIFAALR